LNKSISTNIKKLDEFLGGGIKCGTITDIFGSNGTGKTQLAMQISINVLKNGGKVFFQDTTGGFRPERILEIIKSQDLDSQLLDNMIIGRITNISEQKNQLNKIDEENDFSLIIIDNVTDLFSFEYTKKNQLLQKNISFIDYMHKLSSLTIKRNIPVIVINIMREQNNISIENLEKSISMFTHFKIKLMYDGNKYHGEIFPSFLKKQFFSYLITKQGLIDSS